MTYEVWCPPEWIERYLNGERRCSVPEGAGVGDTVQIAAGTKGYEPGRVLIVKIVSIIPEGELFWPEATVEMVEVLS